MRTLEPDLTSSVCPLCGGSLKYSAPSHHLPVGYLLRGVGRAKYLIGAAKGKGSFGITYIGLNAENGQRVAIKELFPRGCVTRGEKQEKVVCTPAFAGEY